MHTVISFLALTSDSIKMAVSPILVLPSPLQSAKRPSSCNFCGAGTTVQILIVPLPLSDRLMNCAPLCLHIILQRLIVCMYLAWQAAFIPTQYFISTYSFVLEN